MNNQRRKELDKAFSLLEEALSIVETIKDEERKAKEKIKADMLAVLDNQLNDIPSSGNGYLLDDLSKTQLMKVQSFVKSFY